MMVKSFLAWMQDAEANERAEAVDLLARAYVARALGGERPEEVEAALTLVLDDPSPVVRRALALVFADQMDVPRHIILALAHDQADVSGLLIARSPLITEADAIDLASIAEPLALVALALRVDVSPRLGQAIVKRRHRESALALAGNAMAELFETDLLVLVGTFGADARMRETLLARTDLPVTVRHALMVEVAKSLGAYVTGAGFIAEGRQTRLLDEAVQGATLELAIRDRTALPGFVAHLRDAGQLTPALLLRSVLGGDAQLLTQACAELADMDIGRASGLLNSRSEAVVSALFRRMGLPEFLDRPLIAALRVIRSEPRRDGDQRLSLPVIRAAQAACLEVSGEEGVRLLALLRRYEAEAARAEARRIAESLRAEAREELLLISRQAQDDIALLTQIEPEPIDAELESIGYAETGMEGDRAADAGLEDLSPASMPTPDLKTIIAEWKAEREARQRQAQDDMETWSLRRVA